MYITLSSFTQSVRTDAAHYIPLILVVAFMLFIGWLIHDPRK